PLRLWSAIAVMGESAMIWRVALLAATIWIAFGLTGPRITPASAQDSAEVYKNVYNGWKWWHVYCYRCHGTNAVGGNLAPNLIEANRKMPLKEFLYKVKEGDPENGMQAWDKLLDDKQITQLYFYVRARADKVLPPGRPDEVG